MIDCATYRRALLADPHDADPALKEHCERCHDCTSYTQQLLRFESRLERALRVSADPSANRVVPLRAKSPLQRLSLSQHRKGWLAMAASMLMAAVVAGGLWLSVPASSLAADVVTHMQGEPDAWKRTDVPVQDAALRSVLHDSRLRLTAGAGLVSYASSCEFRGHHVPHLVVQTASGPVTVMVLVHEHVSKAAQFDEQGYRGVIVPVAGHGSIAVLTRDAPANTAAADTAAIERISHQVLDSIVWTG